MAKRRIGILKGKPIVEGDSNLISKNEVNIKELGNTGGDSGAASLGLWDSDYLLITSGKGSHPLYEVIKGCLSYATSSGVGIFLEDGGNPVTSLRYTASDFAMSTDTIFGYVHQLPDTVFYTGILRISNATLKILNAALIDKEAGINYFPPRVQESVSSLNLTPCILSDLDIFDVALIIYNKIIKIIHGEGEELSSKEEIKDIILSNEGNKILPAAEAKQLILDNPI